MPLLITVLIKPNTSKPRHVLKPYCVSGIILDSADK